MVTAFKHFVQHQSYGRDIWPPSWCLTQRLLLKDYFGEPFSGEQNLMHFEAPKNQRKIKSRLHLHLLLAYFCTRWKMGILVSQFLIYCIYHFRCVSVHCFTVFWVMDLKRPLTLVTIHHLSYRHYGWKIHGIVSRGVLLPFTLLSNLFDWQIIFWQMTNLATKSNRFALKEGTEYSIKD